MKITFLMPCYCWVPSGGFRVVYEYANQLVARGHRVAVIHPRRLAFPPPEGFTLRQRLRRLRLAVQEARSRPIIDWHKMDPRVELDFVPNSSAVHFPDADVVFATAWHTVESVLALPASKGCKCYLIQGYETFLGRQQLVDATWRAPLRKIAVSKWLCSLGPQLGAPEIAYVPNAVELHLTKPIEHRKRQAVMLVSPVPLKRSQDGIRALAQAKHFFPKFKAVLYGASKAPVWVPTDMPYYCNPSQEFLTQIYNESSLVVSSSRAEGFGLSPAEGAACGCAMVSTDSGGVRDFIDHTVTGLLSPPGDPEALARNICTLLADDELRIRLARRGHERISHFTWSRSTDLMESFLQSVVDGPQASAAEVTPGFRAAVWERPAI